jgi:hypothetical protein
MFKHTSILAVVFAAFIALLPQSFHAQTIPGSYSFEFEGNASIWDVSGTQVISEGGIEMDFTYAVDAKGKITGYGHAYADMSGVEIDTGFAVTGTVTKSGSITRVTLKFKFQGSATASGRIYKFTATVSALGNVDTLYGELDCAMAMRITLAGHSYSEKVDVSFTLDPGVDGSWVMDLNDLSLSRTRIAGTGTIYISGGQEFTFTLSGTYAAKTGKANLSLKGLDAAKGTSFTLKTVVDGPPCCSSLALQSMSGKLMGQTVKR